MDPKSITAFPASYYTDDGEWAKRDGMTLRDYFAAKAMAAVITGSMADGSHLSDGVEVIFSRAAYKFADAMLRARGEA